MNTKLCAIIIALLATIGASIEAARAQTVSPATQPGTQELPDTRPIKTPAVVIRLSGVIDNFNRDALKRRFDEARALGAKTIILEVDTYGGLVTSGLDISRFLKQQTDLRTIAYVREKAISAGIMIALAADELVMAPGAMVGDSAPIASSATGGMEPLPPAERAKAESPVLADFYDSAMRNGYDPLLAESMVSVGRSVYWVQGPTGQKRFVNADTYALITKKGWTDVPGVPVPVDSADTLLTVGTELAAKLGLAKAVYPSVEALADARGLNVLATLAPGVGERAVSFLSGGIVRMVLLTGFLISLYVAMHVPGHGAAEAVATICLGTLLGVPLLTGYAQWWEIIAIVIGLALIALELFVIPGFGVAGVAGILLILGGLLMTFVPVEPGRSPLSWPSMGGTWAAVETGLMATVGAMLASIGLSFWIRKYLPKMPYFSRLILTNVAGGGGVMATNPTLGDDVATWPLVGDTGRTVTDLLPGGSAKFFDDAVGAERATNVVSDSGFIGAGAAVVVREVGGNRVVVRAV